LGRPNAFPRAERLPRRRTRRAMPIRGMTWTDIRNENNNKESNEPDYNDDEKSDNVGEEKQEVQTGEITMTSTTNKVF
jgi:hypothetical protein